MTYGHLLFKPDIKYLVFLFDYQVSAYLENVLVLLLLLLYYFSRKNTEHYLTLEIGRNFHRRMPYIIV